MDDFFSIEDLNEIYNEIESLEDIFKVGDVRNDDTGEIYVNEKYKKNKNIWLHEHFVNGDSKILKLLRKVWFGKDNIEYLREHDNPFFSVITETNYDRTLLSKYNNGDFYGWHKDGVDSPTILTLNIFISHEPKFTGGDFVIERNGKSKTIEFIPNRAVLFPSRTEHMVTEVKEDKHEHLSSRFTIQNWSSLRTK